MAALTGTLVGLVGVGFNQAVNAVQHWRLSSLSSLSGSVWVWPLSILISALLAAAGYGLVRRFAPEAGGSGIPEIEGALEDLRPVRWWRVLPVKFVGGIGTLGAGMVLGREGPTVQLGGNIGGMVAALLPARKGDVRHSLLATGAAAGLSAAFNAPLAGILFIIEEMRPQFRYNLISIKAVFIGVIMSSIVYRVLEGDHAVINVGQLPSAPVGTLGLYLLLGILFGAVGVIFNALVLGAQARFFTLSRPFAAAIFAHRAGGGGNIRLVDAGIQRCDGRWFYTDPDRSGGALWGRDAAGDFSGSGRDDLALL
ncbi:hypothetical protein OS42_33880 [Dickeya oryzae]